MVYLEDITNRIGNTGLMEITRLAPECKGRIFVKPEYLNPAGSVKDRIGKYMIKQAENQGILYQGVTLIEPTSGNTGRSFALLGIHEGYDVILTVPDKVSEEKRSYLRALGATVHVLPTTPKEGEMDYHAFAKQLADDNPKTVLLNQYDNQNNKRAHYFSTGPEIFMDTQGKITHFVAGIGTAGTICGTAEALKEGNKNVKVIGVDPVGSIYYTHFHGLKEDLGEYKVEGVGMDHLTGNYNPGVIDDIVQVSDHEAITMMHRLIKEERLMGGMSSGLAMHGALEAAKDMRKNDVMVVILPDGMQNYLSTALNPEWLREHNFTTQ